MKKTLLIGICSFLSMLVIAEGDLFASSEKPIQLKNPTKALELSLNLIIPPTHRRWTNAIEPWIGELEKRTGGRIKIVPYFASTLSRLPENFDSVAKGVADMGEAMIDTKPGRFPILESIFGCCKPGRLIKDGSRMFAEFLRAVPSAKNEMKDVKVLFVHLAPPTIIGTSKKPIKTLADLKGLKIGVHGQPLVTDKVKALGASPVGVVIPDIYMSVQKGVVDGATAVYLLLDDRRWGEVLHHITPVVLSESPMYVGMNWQVWNKLPADIQRTIEKLSGEYAQDLFDKFWWDVSVQSKKKFEQMGGQTYLFSQKDMEKVDELFDSVVQAWVTKMEGKGYPAKKILEEYRRLEKKYRVPLSAL